MPVSNGGLPPYYIFSGKRVLLPGAVIMYVGARFALPWSLMLALMGITLCYKALVLQFLSKKEGRSRYHSDLCM